MVLSKFYNKGQELRGESANVHAIFLHPHTGIKYKPRKLLNVQLIKYLMSL